MNMKKPGETKIFNALATNPKGLTYTELKEQAKLSNTALAQYLKLMQKTGVLRKDYEHKRYRLATIYFPMEDFANVWQKQMKTAAVYFTQEGIYISKIKNKQQKTRHLQSLLKFAFHELTLYLYKIITESILIYENNIEKIKDQDLAVEKSKVINEAVENWITAIADAVATAMLLNLDVADAAAYPWYKKVVAQAKRNIQQLESLH